MSDEIQLRDGVPSDAAQAAPLIHAAGPVLFDLMFGPRTAQTLRLFQRLYALPRNPFSYDQALIAERDGQIVGLAIAAPRDRRHYGFRMLRLLLQLRGPLALLRQMPNALAIIACSLPPPPDAYYLGILAVAPEARCQGVGSRLILEVQRQAQIAGSPAVALHAERNNAAARRFYARHGYTVTEERASPRAERLGISGFVAMERRV